MTTSFDDYQKRSAATAVYPERGTGSALALAYVSLGLGETGEVQGKVADLLATGSQDDLAEAAAELGDVLWYIAQMAAELDQPLSAVAARRAPSPQAEDIELFSTSVTSRTELPVTVASAALALGAAGDLQGMVKKILRGDPATREAAYQGKLVGKLADVLAAVATLAVVSGIPLSRIAQANLDKLADRATRGVLKGAGDHR